MQWNSASKKSFVCAFSFSILCTPLLFPREGIAQSVKPLTPNSAPIVTNTSTARSAAHHTPQNLDLSSAFASIHATNKSPVNILLGGNLNHGTVTGGKAMTVAPGQLVTPAQYAAVFEAMRGNQTLLLNSQGSASGGVMNLNSTYIHNLASLVVPKAVKVDLIGYSAGHPLNVSGAVNIFGAIYALQNAPALSADLHMGSLNVGAGALLSGNLPTGTNLPNTFASSGLSLNLATNLQNQGVITSPGSLNISAGGNIVNQSANHAHAAVISAQNVNLYSGSGSIVNSGLVKAANTLNLNTLNPTTDLIINNSGGTLQARGPAGTINIRDSAHIESANVGVWGGVLDAKGGIKMFGKDMEVAVDHINGAINNTGSVAHLSVKSGDLVLGDQILSGDPTYYNTGGNITLANLTAGSDIAIVASGSILTNALTTIKTNAADFSIFLGAGLGFSSDGPPVAGFPSGDSSSTLTFDGSTNAGGDINNSSIHTLNLSTTGTGTITLVATGVVNMGGGTISSANGDILIISGTGFTGTGGHITSTSGNVTISNSDISNLNGMTIFSGTVSSLPTPGANPASGNISMPSINTSNDLNVTTAGAITSAAAVSANNVTMTTDIGSNSNIAISGALTGASSVTLTADGSLNLTNSINSPGAGGVTLTANSGGITSNISATINSGGVVSITNSAADINLVGAIDNSSAGGSVITIDSLNNNVIVGAVTSNGAISLGDGNSCTGVTLNGAVNNSPTGTGSGDVNILTGTTGDIIGHGNNVTSAGALNITTQAGDITFTGGTLTANGGDINVLATNSGNVKVNAVTNNSPSNLVTINAGAGTTTVGTIIAQGGQVNIGNNSSGLDVTLNGSINNVAGDGSGSGVTILTATGAITGSAITSDGLINIVANGGLVSFNGTIDNSSSTGSSSITVDSLTSTVTVKTVSSSGPIQLGDNSVNCAGVTLSGPVSNISGTGNINIQTVSGDIFGSFNVSSAGDLNIQTLNSGNITFTGGQLSSTSGNIDIEALAAGNVQIGAVSAPLATAITVNAATGTTTVGAITAANGGQVNIGNNSGGLAVTLNGTIDNTTGLGGGADINVQTFNGGITGTQINSEGTIFITANGGPVSFTAAIDNTFASTNKSITVDSTTNTVTVATVSSNGPIQLGDNVNACSGVTLHGPVSNTNGGGDISIFTVDGNINGNSFNVTSNANLTIQTLNSGNVTFFGGTLTAANGGNLDVEALGTSGNVSVNVLNNTSTGTITLNSVSGTASASGAITGLGGQVTVGGSSVTLAGIDNTTGVSTGNGVTITSSNGAITGTTISSDGSIAISSTSGLISFTGLINNTTGGGGSIGIDTTTGNTISTTGVQSTGPITIGDTANPSGISLHGNVDNSSGSGDIQISSNSGDIAGNSFSVTSAGKLTINTGSTGGVTFFGGTLTANSGDLDVEAFGSGAVSLNDVANPSGGLVTLNASAGSTSAGNITATGGGAVSVGNSSTGKSVSIGAIDNRTGGGSGANVTVLTAAGSITGSSIFSDGQINATAINGQVSFSSTIDNSSGTITQPSNITVDSSNNSISTTGVHGSGSVTIGNTGGTAGVTLHAEVVSDTGDVQILSKTSGIAGNSANVTAAGKVIITSQASGDINFFGGTITANGGVVDVEAIAAGDVAVNDVIDTFTNGNVTLNSSSGATSAGTITAAGGFVALGNNTSGAGVTVGAINNTNSGSGNGVNLFAKSGPITASTISSDGAIKVIDGLGTVNVTGLIDNSTGTSLVSVDSNNTINITGVTSRGAISIGNLTSNAGVTLHGDISNVTGNATLQIATSSGSISGNSFSVSSTGDLNIEVASGTGDINFFGGTISSAGQLTVLVPTAGSTGNISINNISDSSAKHVIVLANAGTVSVEAVNDSGGGSVQLQGTSVTLNGSLQNTHLGSGAGVSLTATNGNVTAMAASTINSDGIISVTATNGNVLLTGAVDNSSAGTAGSSTITVDATNGTISTTGASSRGAITIGNSVSTNGITLNGAISNSTGTGNISVVTNSGGISGNSSSVTSMGTLTITQQTGAGDIVFFGGTLSSKGTLDIETLGSGNVSVNDVTNTSFSSTVTINALTGTTGAGAITAKGGQVSIGNSTQGSGVTLNGTLNNTTVLGSGGVSVLAASGGITASGGSSLLSNGSINIVANAGNILLTGGVDNSTALTAGSSTLNIDSKNGSLTVGAVSSKAAITIGDSAGTNGITLNGALVNSSGTGDITIASQTGGISGSIVTSKGGLSITQQTGSQAINFIGTLSASGGPLTVKTLGGTGNVQLSNISDTSSGATVNISSFAGSTSVGFVTANGGAVTLSGATNVSVGGDLFNQGAAAGDVSITSSNGGITSTGGSTINSSGAVTITAGGGAVLLTGAVDNTSGTSSVTIDSTNNTVGLLAVNSNGVITIGDTSGTAAVTLNGVVSTSSMQAVAIALNSPTSITANANITASGGGVAINTPNLNIGGASTVQGTAVSLTGASGTLTVNNAGVLQANSSDITITSAAGQNIDITGSGQMAASSGVINITAPASGIIPSGIVFSGNQTFRTHTVLNAAGINQSVTINSLVNVTIPLGQAININTNTFVKQGTIGPGAVILSAVGAGTIINPSGSIDLKDVSNLVFHGNTLSIIASGDITNTGGQTTIDLSAADASGGGSLNLIAGFNSSPNPSSTIIPVTGIFTIGSAAGTGNISLSNVDIDTSATGPFAAAGNVQAIANGGSITLGNITATANAASGNGGAIFIIGNGVSAGTINTNASAGGFVSISSASTIQTTGTIVSSDGIISGGTFSPGAGPAGGNIIVNGNINAQGSAGIGGSVTLSEHAASNGTIKVTGHINTGGTTAGAVTLLADNAASTTSTIEVDNGISAVGSSGAAGSVQISEINTGASLIINADSSAPAANTIGSIIATGAAGSPSVQISNTGGNVSFGKLGIAVNAAGPISVTAGTSILGGGAGSGILKTTNAISGLTLQAGTDAGNTSNVVASNSSVLNVTGTNGAVNVNNTNGSTLTVNTATNAADLSITSDNGLQINAAIAPANRNVTLVSSSGALLILQNVSGASITATAGSISSTAGHSLISSAITLVAQSGVLGPLSTIDAGTLAVGASSGSINLTNTGNLQLSVTAGPASTFNLNNTGNLLLASPINGPSGLTITLASGNGLTNGGFAISSTASGPINLTMDSFAGNGVINAGTGTVTINSASAAGAITLAGPGPGLNLSLAQLSSITAANLVIGSNASTGTTTLAGPLDAHSAYNLQLLQGGAGGTITTTGQTITLGTKTLTINAGGAVNLGTISTSGTTLNITGGSVTLNGPVGSAGDIITIASTAGSITGVGVLTSNAITLSAATGSLANVGPLTTVDAGSLSATATGSVIIRNSGALAFNAIATVGGIFLSNTGNVSLNNSVNGQFQVEIDLDAGSTLSNNGFLISTDPLISHISVILKTNSLNLSGANSITGGIVSISPVSASTPIVFGSTVAGSLSLTQGQLSSITAHEVDFGSTTGTGSVTVSSALTLPYLLEVNQGASSFDSTSSALNFTGTGSLAVNLASGNIAVNSITTSNQGIVSLRTHGAASNIALTNGVPVSHSIILLADSGTISGLGNNATITTITPLTSQAGDGGNIFLSASNLISTQLNLNVDGSGGIAGGVEYISTSNVPFIPNSSQLKINASGTSAGSVFISTGGNFTFNPGSGSSAIITANPTSPTGHGAQITLTAGTGGPGNLLVTDVINADGGASGGSGGFITLNSNSATPFLIDSSNATINGTQKPISVGTGGGIVGVFNKGGGITNDQVFNVGELTFGATAGSVIINQPITTSDVLAISTTGSGSILSGTNVLTGLLVTLNSGAANIGTGAAGGSGALLVSTAGLIAITGGTGSVNIKNVSPLLTIQTIIGSTVAVSSSGNINLQFGSISASTSVNLQSTAANGNINLGTNITVSNTSTGSVTLTAGSGAGSGSITGSAPIQAKTVTLNTGSAGSIGTGGAALELAAANVFANSAGDINLDNVGFNPGTGAVPITITSAGTTKTFALQSATPVTITPTLANATAITIGTSGSAGITLKGATLGSAATTNAISLSTVSGAITGAATITTIANSNDKVSLASVSGTIGTATAPLKVNSLNIAPGGTPSLINISDTNAASSANPILVSTAMTSTGTLTFASAGSTTFNNSVSGSSVKLTTSGNGITINGNTTAATSVTITDTGNAATNGFVKLNGIVKVLNTSTGLITVTASGTGTITEPVLNSGSFQARTVVLSTAPLQSIGAANLPVQVAAVNLTANTTGTVALANLGYNLPSAPGVNGSPITITASNSNNFSLLSATAVTITPTLASATSISIDTSNGGTGTGGITLNGATLGSATTTTSIDLKTANGNITGPATISEKTNALLLTSTSGSFGTASTALKVNVPKLTPTTTQGLINISDTFTGATTVNSLTSLGSVSFSSSGPTTLPTTIAGGSVTLRLGGSSTTILNIPGATTINAGAGTISISPSTSNVPISIENVAASGLSFTANQLNSNFTAGTLIIGSNTSTGGITVNTGISLTQNNNLVLAQGAGSFTSTATITLTGGSFGVTMTSGNIKAGSISNPTGAVSLQTNGAASSINLGSNPSTNLPDANSISLLAGTGTIAGLTGSVSFIPQQVAGNGGSVFLSASNLTKANITIDVHGTGTGNGGTASYVNTSTAAFSPSAALLNITISGHNAGTAIISTGGNFTFSPSIVTNTSIGDGEKLTLTAGSIGTGTLSIASGLSADAQGPGVGGSITLNSNSPTAFSINPAAPTANSINGSISVLGNGSPNGSVTITNRGGGITAPLNVSSALPNFNNLRLDTTGAVAGTITVGYALGSAGVNSISLIAGGSGSISLANNTLTANTITLASGTGSIGGTTGGASPIAIIASNLSARTTGAGTVNIVNNPASAAVLNLAASSAGSTFVLNSKGDIDTNGAITAGTSISLTSTAANGNISLQGNLIATNASTGAITLTATGSGSVSDAQAGTDSVQAKTVTVNSTSGTIGAAVTPFRVETASLSVNSTGLANINNLGLNKLPLTVTAAGTNSNSFTLQSATAVTSSLTFSSVSSLGISIRSGSGGITLNGLTVGGSSTNSINLTTLSGNISTATNTTISTTAAGTINLTSSTGSLGTSTVALKIATGTLDANTISGLININDTNGGTVNSLATAGSLTFRSGAATTFNGNVSGSTVSLAPSDTTIFNSGISATAGTVSLVQSGANTPTTVNGNITATKTVSISTAGAAAFANITANGGALTVSTQGSSSFGSVVGIGASGAVTITQSQSGGAGLTFVGPSSAGSTFTVSNAGSGGINTSGQISAPSSVTLKNTGVDGSINLNGNVIATNTSTGAVTLTAQGTGSIIDLVTNGPDSVQAKTVTINAASGTGAGQNNVAIGSASTPLRIKSSGLAANATGLVNINNLGFNPGTGAAPLTLTSGSSSNSFTLKSITAVTITPTLSNATSIGISTSSSGTTKGGITLNGAGLGGANTDLVSLTTDAGNITGAGVITTKAVVGIVALTSTSGNFGSAATALKIIASVFTPSTTNGLINLNDSSTGIVSVNGMSTSAALSFSSSSSSSTTFNGAIAGSSVTLNTSGTTIFNGNIASSTGAVLLNEKGTSGPTTFNLSGVGAKIISAATTITLNTIGSTTFGNNISVLANAFAPNPNALTANPANNGVIAISAATGMLSLGSSDNFWDNGKTAGSITLLEKTNAIGSGINIGNNSTLNTLLSTKSNSTVFPLPGQISLAIGNSVPTAPQNPNPSQKPFLATVNLTNPSSKSNAYWGANPTNIDATAGAVTMNVTGNSAIVFNAGSTSKIVLGSGATFTADPPVASPGTAAALPVINAALAASHVGTSKTINPGLSAVNHDYEIKQNTNGALPAVPRSFNTVISAGAQPLTGQGYVNPASTNVMPVYQGRVSQFPSEIASQSSSASPGSESIYGETGTCKNHVHELRDGAIVMAPDEDSTIVTPFANIEVDARSIVLVFASKHGIAVYCIDDQHRDAVRIQTNGRRLALSPGRQAMITHKQVRAFESINPFEGVGYRGLTQLEIGDGLRAFVSEFSIPSAINAVKPLKNLISSKNAQTMRHVLKTAAAMMQLKQGAEPFQQFSHPRVAAYLPQ